MAMLDWIKRLLYRHLSLDGYLKALSFGFFAGLRLGLGKRSAAYEYPRFLKHLVHQGYTAIDIGANLGYYSRILAQIVGENGKVYAVEPVKPILKVLAHNLRGLDNVEILPYALGAENRNILLLNDSAHSAGYLGTGRNYIPDNDEQVNKSLSFEAHMRRGSELFGELERLDFIKCDIEGYETVVLEEMWPVIEKFRPTVLVETGGANRKKLIDMFRALGYAGYVLQNGKLVSVMRAKGEKDIVFKI